MLHLYTVTHTARHVMRIGGLIHYLLCKIIKSKNVVRNYVLVDDECVRNKYLKY